MATDAPKQQHILVVGSSPRLVCLVAERLAASGSFVSVVLEPGFDSAAQRPTKASAGRIQVLAGGSSRIDFGLSGSSYRALVEQVTAIVDLDPLGTGPRVFGSPSAAAPGREVVELARVAERISRVISLSSVMVAGDFKGVFAENDVGLPKAVRDPFAAKLARKERILRRLSPRVPIDIVRTGWVVGEQPGLCPLVPLLFAIDDERLEAVSGQFLPLTSLGTLLDLLEHRLLTTDDNDSRTFHLFERQADPVESLHAQVSTLAAEFAPRAFDLRRGAQRVLAGDALRGWELEYFWQLHHRRTRYSGRATERYLDGIGLALPPFDEQLLRQLVSGAVEEMGGFK